MGLRGPAPKPTALRILEGNPSRRPLPKREPRPERGAPRCPAWLDSTGRAEWRRVVPLLDRLGLLTKIDRTALAMYCDAYSQFLAASNTIKQHGFSYRLESGYIQQRPEVSIYHKLHTIIKGWCREFGLTVSARGQLMVEQDDTGDDLDAILGRKSG